MVEVDDEGDLTRLIEEEARRMGFRLVEFRLKLFGERRHESDGQRTVPLTRTSMTVAAKATVATTKVTASTPSAP